MKARNPLKDPQPGDIFTTDGIFPEVITILARDKAAFSVAPIRKGTNYVQFTRDGGFDGSWYGESLAAMLRRLRGATVGRRVHARPPGHDETWQITGRRSIIHAPRRKTA